MGVYKKHFSILLHNIQVCGDLNKCNAVEMGDMMYLIKLIHKHWREFDSDDWSNIRDICTHVIQFGNLTSAQLVIYNISDIQWCASDTIPLTRHRQIYILYNLLDMARVFENMEAAECISRYIRDLRNEK